MTPGSWPSSITPQHLTQGTVKLREVHWDDQGCAWLEGRPDRGGSQQVLRWTPNGETPLTPDDFNVKSGVHGYGGAAFRMHDQMLYVSGAEGEIWRVPPGQAPEALTKTGWQFADFTFHPELPLAVAVCERPGENEPENLLVQVHLETGEVTDWRRGADFYAYPRFSPDGEEISWLEWLHPLMPWEETSLRVSPWPAPDPMRIAGSVAVFQPEWSPEGELTYVADYDDWWNLYQDDESLCEKPAEFGLPLWQLGMSTYGFLEDRILAACTKGGLWQIGEIKDRTFHPVEADFTLIESVATDGRTRGAFFGATPALPKALTLIEDGKLESIRPSSPAPDHFVSEPEALSFPTGQGEWCHGFYYPPAKEGWKDRAPLIVICHGGPTGATTVEYDPQIQYWTTRGFGILDVNYRGSTGYGRAYRERLYGGWGVVDVEDVIAGAQFLIETGRAHVDQVAIRGKSAGGLTVLGALARSNLFRAGVSYYGVSDLRALQEETHKFEAHYNQTLIGTLSDGALTERSPSSHVSRIGAPVLFFQGTEDTVVPPNQSRSMAESLTQRGIPTVYREFEGEGHGFRKASTIETAFAWETAFYRAVFGLEDPDAGPTLPFDPPLPTST